MQRRPLGPLVTLGAVGIVTVAILPAFFARNEAANPAAARSEEVVMLRCDAASSRLEVSAYAGSAAAPAKKAETCPESLSLLLEEGFRVEDVGHYDHESRAFFVLTLVR